jgi:hypothetical protein
MKSDVITGTGIGRTRALRLDAARLFVGQTIGPNSGDVML